MGQSYPQAEKRLTPDQVIDEVERCLELGKPFAYPGKQTKFGVIMRRLFRGVGVQRSWTPSDFKQSLNTGLR